MRKKTGPNAKWLAPDSGRDADLLSRMKRGEPEALGELYDRYGRLAYSIILRIVRNADVAEDLLAETFVTAWNQSARWRDPRFEDLHLWLCLLARSHAIEHLRSRNDALPKSLPRPAALTKPSVLQDFPRPRNVEQWEQLHEAFAELSDKEAEILELTAFDGVPVSEIAVTSGETVAALKEIIRVALEKIGRV